MTLAWPEMTYTRFGSKTLRAPSSPDLNPLEKIFISSFKSPTCKSYHSKITSIKIYCQDPEDPPFGVPGQDVIGLQPGRDQVIGVEVKKFQSIQENMSVTISYFIQNLLKCSFLRFWQSWKTCHIFLILAAAPCTHLENTVLIQKNIAQKVAHPP